MIDCKIIVNNETESTIAQLCLMNNGAKWGSNNKVTDITFHGYTYPMFLFVKNDEITFDPYSDYGKEYFINHQGKWLTLNELLNIIKEGGK